MSLLKNTGKLAGTTLFITGASRGIGKSIALKAAQDGANIVIAAKTAEPHPKLPGTIFTAAKEIEAAGGSCLPCVVDIREESQIQAAVDKAVEKFGGIDILVNNASAISLTRTLDTTMKKYDLMMDINTRGTFLTSKLCLPHLLKSKNPHILNISPPLNMKPIWFANHCAYTMAKYGMSLCVLGMAKEFQESGVAVNALWPRTSIATAAIEMLMGESGTSEARKPEIMGDAAYAILTKPSRELTGQFLIDDDVVRKEGVSDLEPYSVTPGSELMPDFFLDEAEKYLNSFFSSSSSSSPPDINTPAGIFNSIRSMASEAIVKQMGATYLFVLSGENSGNWLLDLKTGSGSIQEVSEDTSADVTFTMDSKHMVELFQGKINATAAFMTGKLKISGNMGLAMKLDKLLGQVKSKL
ncbi:PREDICTED: hydroxysteroid dehydrogenase-like protein 2 [Amphimedon queenslandica]|uniref:Hydroxysteroid dehydrogenase-like protein 2 n=1 Tax=Amphimedon queenslandica TaxID=400682 RepID=A0A1X7UNU1_AMPQE|nr:PREDICTED: hydroxysteroid dehydrogenase-like protein 2 [Amphimedon queenslandica]|eukprot:XP_003387239.1 PREDICTED: hydroxysteroid dehydrogenase-like protein 2 [Amphimedon queenslandica]